MNKPHALETVNFRCPFCGRAASVVCAIGDEADSFVIHALPFCLQFLTLDPLPYIEAVNRKFASRGN